MAGLRPGEAADRVARPPTTSASRRRALGALGRAASPTVSSHELAVSVAPTAPRMASPRAAPTWRAAFITPEAMPDFSRSTAAMAMDEVVGIVRARPPPIRT